MSGYVVVGTQWGDEGKGKLVDLLGTHVDMVVRFQGGNNAGHTVVVNGQKTILHLLPSGILNTESVCVIGPGVVVNPTVLLKEMNQLKEQGLTIFLTTHYMEEAEALCDRVCIIKSGKKVAEGTIDEVIAASGQKNLEDAYLFFMGEEELL